MPLTTKKGQRIVANMARKRTPSNQVKHARKVLGLTRKQLSDKLGGVDRSTICRWENGERNPSPMALAFIEKLISEAQT